jgi:hypothetical protein
MKAQEGAEKNPKSVQATGKESLQHRDYTRDLAVRTLDISVPGMDLRGQSLLIRDSPAKRGKGDTLFGIESYAQVCFMLRRQSRQLLKQIDSLWGERQGVVATVFDASMIDELDKKGLVQRQHNHRAGEHTKHLGKFLLTAILVPGTFGLSSTPEDLNTFFAPKNTSDPG